MDRSRRLHQSMLLWDPEGLGGQVWQSETLVDRNDMGNSKVPERWLFCSVVFINLFFLKKWFFKRWCQSLDNSIAGEHKETKGVWSWLLHLHSSEAIQRLFVPTSESKVANRMWSLCRPGSLVGTSCHHRQRYSLRSQGQERAPGVHG